jgi:hypothetical protein
MRKYLLHGAVLSIGLAVAGCAGQSSSQSTAPGSTSAVAETTGAATTGVANDHGSAEHDAVAHTHGTSLQFTSQPQQIVGGQPTTWTLKIVNDSDAPVQEFAVVHDKLMHLIVVSQDLSWFNHLHPEYKGNGVFSLRTSLPRAGQYKLFADYTPKDGEHEVAQQEVRVGGSNALPVKPTLVADKMRGGWMTRRVSSHDEGAPPVKGGTPYEVALMPMPANLEAGKDAMLHFQVRDAQGKPLKNLQPYLGAMGHAVILSSDAKNYLHTHPADGEHAGHEAMSGGAGNGGAKAGGAKAAASSTGGGPDVMFHTNFPTSGLYKVWAQFRHNNKIITAPFVLRVGATQTSVASGSAVAPAGLTYTCEMHPEVKSNKPGKCPKCGMELVPVTPRRAE